MKNPLVQMALPMALTYAAGPIGAKLGGMGLFKGMSPLMANALKQSALGFGTAALSGSKRPWKGAMYAGLTSIPFSYMSAARAADAFNQDYAGRKGFEKLMEQPTKIEAMGPVPGAPGMTRYGLGEPNFKFAQRAAIPKVSAWDIMTGKTRSAEIPPLELLKTDQYDPDAIRVGDPSEKYKSVYKRLGPTETVPLEASIFSKPERLKDYGLTGETVSDWIPTMASQAAALYGGRDTPEEEWEAARKKRRKELAWMYGVDEDQIEGEMLNPWYSGGMFNSGGIASLDMSYGGDVSGPGGPKDDMIDAKLSDGEFVMTAKAVENFGNGDRYEGARKMYDMMNMLDPESETMSEVVQEFNEMEVLGT